MLSQWIESICLVKFDIEIGQIVEWTQPLKSITEQEEKNISMLAFPDSNAFSQNEGHLKYVFRVRRSGGKNQFSLGFALFMQRKDEDNPRGYTQKSIVILTILPLVTFYYNLLEIIYQNIKQGCLKAQLQHAYEQINSWEKPQPNQVFNLQIFNNKIAVEVPHYLKMQKVDSQMNVELQQVLDELTLTNMIQLDDLRDIGQFQEANIFAALPHSMLVHLPKLWELILTNQQFMVIADSPYQCSEIILGMISLISPMKFSGDYRPYFTIYDKEFQQINQELENSIVRNIIIGVTNPFFLKALKKFPIIIRCDSQAQQNRLQTQGNKEFCLLDDRQTLKMMIPIKNEETKTINNSLIKKVYRNMSLEFIGLFEMYFANQQNQVKKFDEKEFLEFTKNCKVSFQDLFENKQKFVKLYQTFIRSSNFVTYLNERKNVYIAKSII
ncbi:unnamed protein product [Paramecium sonneborni]|uniref:UDENN domain-containing protein n=1 Tax=Paramecium sonneborni TaxID=65129 RepID=A0A8S1RTF3_9CILI|nr:unnamed protein product [Paramecium sonneborni]